MRVVGTVAVRNGADIVEAAVRHNLAALDGLVVLVHGASDRTPAILAALADEGLALKVLIDEDPAADPAALERRLAREGFADPAADWVVGFEAGDFLKPASRPVLQQALATADPQQPVALPVHTYVPDFASPAAPLSRFASARRLAAEPRPLERRAVPRACAARGGDDPAIPRAANTIAVARVPVRSIEQLTADCVMTHLAGLAAGTSTPLDAWAEAVYLEVRAGRMVTAALAEAAAVNAGCPRSQWVDPAAVPRVEDPFLVPMTLSHTAATPPYVLGQLMALGEYLAWNEARRIQSQLLRGADAGAALARDAGVKGPPR